MDKEELIFLGAASVTGALTGLGLSFTALSPLVIGGIIAAIPVILFTAYIICDSVKKENSPRKIFSFLLIYALQALQLELALLQPQLLFFLAQCLGCCQQL